MTYEQASREAERLVEQGWFQNFARLGALHDLMTFAINKERFPGYFGL